MDSFTWKGSSSSKHLEKNQQTMPLSKVKIAFAPLSDVLICVLVSWPVRVICSGGLVNCLV